MHYILVISDPALEYPAQFVSEKYEFSLDLEQNNENPKVSGPPRLLNPALVATVVTFWKNLVCLMAYVTS